MASGDPFTVNLSGTKNGSNRNFTFPVTPDQTKHILVVQAGKYLRPMHILDPGGTVAGGMNWKLTGTVDVEVGMAPVDTNEALWAQGFES